MSTKPFGLAVKALVADDQDRVLLIRRSLDSKSFKHQWDLPGGKVDPGETFDTALLREVQEETGLAVSIQGVAGAAEYEMPQFRVVFLFLETRCTGGEIQLSSEHDAFTWVPRREMTNLDISGQLQAFLNDYCRRSAGDGPGR